MRCGGRVGTDDTTGIVSLKIVLTFVLFTISAETTFQFILTKAISITIMETTKSIAIRINPLFLCVFWAAIIAN